MKKKYFFLFAFSVFTSPGDEYFRDQWYLKNEGYSIRRDFSEISSISVPGVPGSDMGFPFAWRQENKPLKNVVVAILDTGIDIGHPELKNSIFKSSECDSLGNIPPKNSPDLDANGYKGDCAGWNFTSSQSREGDNQVYDDTGHGTHLAGLISAKADGYGIRGISDQIKILPVKIFSKYEIQNHPLRPKMPMMERIQKGLEYAISKNVDVINLSLGWPSALDSPKIRELFELARLKNILIVAAAGNNAQHTTIFPCSYHGVICVGAHSVDGRLAPFSNFGGNVDLIAPGERILSTVPKKITPLYFDEDGFDFKNGTSQAAPLVAGSAAFLKMALGWIDVDEIKARLLSSGTDSAGNSLYGNLNLRNALESKPKQFLYLNLKDLNTVEVSYPDGQIEFQFQIEKLIPGIVQNAELILDMGLGITLKQKRYLFSMNQNEQVHLIKVAGRIQDWMLPSTQSIRISLIYDENRKSFQKEMVLALKPSLVSQKVSFEENVSIDQLRSVDNPFRLMLKPVFFTADYTVDSMKMVFYSEIDKKMKKLFDVTKEGEFKPLAVTSMGNNQVGLELYDVKNQKIVFEFLNSATGRLERKLEMLPQYAFYHLSQGTRLKGLGGVVLASGMVPPQDENNSVFLSKSKIESEHLYFFAEKDGDIETRILDHEQFRKSLFKKYKLRFDDAIFPIAILNEGIVDELESLFVIGKGYQRKLLWIRHYDSIHFEVVKEFLLPAAGAIRKVSFLGKPILVLQESKDAYRVFDLKSGDFKRYQWNDRFDDLIGPITPVGDHQLLAQTQNHFVVLGGEDVVQLPVKRFSFLPGELYSEMYTPLEIRSSIQSFPALFIDGTMLSERHAGVVLWNGHDLSKPIYFQHKLDEGCRVMNPRLRDGDYAMILACHNAKEFPYLLIRNLRIEN